MKTATEFLDDAKLNLEEKAKNRDQKDGERNMAKIVSMFNTLTGKDLRTSDGWKFMVLLKIVRAETGTFNPDDYIDGSSYFALLGEEKNKEV